MPEPIPGAALSAATLAIEGQPAGSSAAHLARSALEAAVPVLRAGTRTEYGVRRRGEADPFVSGAEGGVRKMAAAGGHLGAPLDVVHRQVTPWTVAAENPVAEAREDKERD